jgi:hypothetical protein
VWFCSAKPRWLNRVWGSCGEGNGLALNVDNLLVRSVAFEQQHALLLSERGARLSKRTEDVLSSPAVNNNNNNNNNNTSDNKSRPQLFDETTILSNSQLAPSLAAQPQVQQVQQVRSPFFLVPV